MSFPAEEPRMRTQSIPMTYEQALSIIARAKQDKFMARELEQLREKCCLFISDVMRDVNLAFAEKDKKMPALLRGKGESAVSLRAAAGAREQMARQRRELAEAIVIGALLNSDNPNWNPMNPSESRSGSGSLLLALLKSSDDWKA